MLKYIFELVVPTVERSDDEKPTDPAVIRRTREVKEQAIQQRQEVDPINIEKELRLHCGRLITEIDHLVDVLGLMAMKTKDDYEIQSRSSPNKLKFTPEFAYWSKERSFGLYWRKVTHRFAQKDGMPGSVQSKRIPIQQGTDINATAGFYPKTIFSRLEDDDRKLASLTEDQFKEIRYMLKQLSTMKRTVEVVDRHATKFFNNAIIFDTQPRTTTCKTDDVPSTEEPTFIERP